MAAQIGNRSLMIVMSASWFYKVQISYELGQQRRAERERFQLPVAFRMYSGFNGDTPEQFRFEAQQIGVLNVSGWLLDDESENLIRLALSALAISDPVQEIIVNALFYHADKQSMWVDIARQELRRGQSMVRDGRTQLYFCPPLKGIVSGITGQIWLTETSRARVNLPRELGNLPRELGNLQRELGNLQRELELGNWPAFMARRRPATESAIDGLEKYKLLAVKPVPMWRREETNSNTTISNSDPTECAICLQEFEVGAQVIRMPCKGDSSWHIFHQHCVAKWLQTSRTCPLCRHPLPPRHL